MSKNVLSYGKSLVPKMDHFEIIMAKYNAVGTSMSVRAFYDSYVKEINPLITLRMWQGFMAKFSRNVKAKASKVLELSEDRAVSDMDIENRSMRKIASIADVTLDELIKRPELLNQVSVDKRIDWLVKIMKARDSRITTLLKKREDDRKQTAYDELMSQAQYGEIDDAELSDVKITKDIVFDPEKEDL